MRARRYKGLKEPAAAPISLNIKNAETCQLIRELAELTGATMTAAVTEAVRERLNRLRGKRAGLAQRLLAIGKDCADRLGDDFRRLDYDALLYDEKGLPR
jgi:antitoxin VapB